MKKIILPTLVTLSVLFFINLAYAQDSYPIEVFNSRSEGCGVTHYRNCDNKFLFEAGFDESNGRSNEVKNKILNELKKRIETRVNVLLIANPSVSNAGSCQKISQTLWEGKFTGKMRESEIAQMDLLLKFLQTKNFLSFPDTGGQYGFLLPYSSDVTKAVKKFQIANDIKQTGAVGQQTLAKINSIICGEDNLSTAIIFDTKQISVPSNNFKFSLKWNVLPSVINKVQDKNKLYVILELVDNNNNKLDAIGDGWSVGYGYMPVDYPIWDSAMHTINGIPQGLPTYKVKIKARLSYQPTMSGCDPLVKGECSPIYNPSEKYLIDYVNNLPATYSELIRFAE